MGVGDVLNYVNTGLDLASGIDSLFGGDNGSSSASESTTYEPSAFSSMGPRASDVWDMAMNSLLGGYSANDEYTSAYNDFLRLSNEAQSKIREDPSQAAQIRATYAPLISAARSKLDQIPKNDLSSRTPSLLERIQEDWQYKKDASDAYLDEMTGVDTDFLNALDSATGGFKGKLGESEGMIKTPKFYLNLGGRNVGAVPGANRNAANLLAQLAEAGYNADINRANTGYQVGSGAATRDLTAAETYAPNAAQIDFTKNFLFPLAMQMQGLRYQTPSQTTTGTLSSDPSFLEKLQTVSQTVTPVIEQIKTWWDDRKKDTED